MKAKLKIASALLLMSNLAGAQEQKAPRPLDPLEPLPKGSHARVDSCVSMVALPQPQSPAR